jgi:hypothetical protein
MFPLVLELHNHVAAHIHEEWVDALSDHLLDIWPLDESREKLYQLQSHALDAMGLLKLILVRFKTPSFALFFIRFFLKFRNWLIVA